MTVRLWPGDVIVLFSDGFKDAYEHTTHRIGIKSWDDLRKHTVQYETDYLDQDKVVRLLSELSKGHMDPQEVAKILVKLAKTPPEDPEHEIDNMSVIIVKIENQLDPNLAVTQKMKAVKLR